MQLIISISQERERDCEKVRAGVVNRKQATSFGSVGFILVFHKTSLWSMSLLLSGREQNGRKILYVWLKQGHRGHWEEKTLQKRQKVRKSGNLLKGERPGELDGEENVRGLCEWTGWEGKRLKGNSAQTLADSMKSLLLFKIHPITHIMDKTHWGRPLTRYEH